MKEYISEGRAIYEDNYHGFFSKKLAEWAIEHMEVKDEKSGETKPLKPRSLNEVRDIINDNGIELEDEFIYTAWYLFNMAMADYPKTLEDDAKRASYVEETLLDPDGCPESVLECFVAKMCVKKIPIYWEFYL